MILQNHADFCIIIAYQPQTSIAKIHSGAKTMTFNTIYLTLCLTLLNIVKPLLAAERSQLIRLENGRLTTVSTHLQTYSRTLSDLYNDGEEHDETIAKLPIDNDTFTLIENLLELSKERTLSSLILEDQFNQTPNALHTALSLLKAANFLDLPSLFVPTLGYLIDHYDHETIKSWKMAPSYSPTGAAYGALALKNNQLPDDLIGELLRLKDEHTHIRYLVRILKNDEQDVFLHYYAARRLDDFAHNNTENQTFIRQLDVLDVLVSKLEANNERPFSLCLVYCINSISYGISDDEVRENADFFYSKLTPVLIAQLNTSHTERLRFSLYTLERLLKRPFIQDHIESHQRQDLHRLISHLSPLLFSHSEARRASNNLLTNLAEHVAINVAICEQINALPSHAAIISELETEYPNLHHALHANL